MKVDSPVTASTSCCRRRLPVFLLICRKEMRSLAATAGYKATGQETRESFKKPFQCARGTKLILHTRRHARTALKWLFGFTFLSLIGQG